MDVNIQEIINNFEAALTAFVVFIGTLYTLFTALAKIWDRIFKIQRGNELTLKIGAFLRRFSLLPDEKGTGFIELKTEKK